MRPEHGFAALVGFDERRRYLWFTGGADPTADDLFVVKDGALPERVATGDGLATLAVAISRDGSRLLVTRTTATEMPRTAVYGFDGAGIGARIAELPSVAVEPPFASTTTIEKVGAGEGIWASLLRPRQFTAGKKLPVIVDVYGGPAHQHVARTPRLSRIKSANPLP